MYRTVYAGCSMQCDLPADLLSTPGGGVAVRLREEVMVTGEGGRNKIVTSPWSAPCLLQDSGHEVGERGKPKERRRDGVGTSADSRGGDGIDYSDVKSAELRWSEVRMGPGVRLSTRIPVIAPTW